MKPVIVSCAITGGIHTPSMSPHLPVTADEITTAAIDAANAGASIIHLHARNPETGKPDHQPDTFMQFLPRISKQTIANKLFGDEYEWSVLGAGRHQFPMATQAAMLGGNVRVGLEDNLYINKGELATSNAQQVTRIKTILTELGMTIATPDETRKRLNLKGLSQVAYAR